MIVIMTNTRMELFQFLQKIYRQCGIRPYRSDHNLETLKLKYHVVLFVIMQFAISSIAYCACNANSIGQLADSFYIFLTDVTCLAFLAITNLKINDIYGLIENFEAFIEKRKQKWLNIYDFKTKVNCKIE